MRRTVTERVTPQWLRSAGRHRSEYTPTTGAWVPRALDLRTESHSCCWECSASTSRQARPSAGSAGSEWRPIASPRTSPKNIRVPAELTCRRRSCGRTQPSKSDRRSRRQAASGRANGDLLRQSFWHSLPLMSPVSLGVLRCSQLVNEDAQQGTGCSFDQFLPPWRQRGHRVVRGQFAYKVVNACLRARLYSLDDANIDPPPPILFVHIASLHEPALSASSCAPLDGATRLRGVVQQDLCTVQAARHYPSLPSCVWSNTDARLAECEFVAPWQLIDARQIEGVKMWQNHFTSRELPTGLDSIWWTV